MNGRDFLHTRAPDEAALGAFAYVDAVQERHPVLQVLGAAAFLRIACTRLSLTPEHVLEVVEAMERDCRYRNVNTFEAVRAYIDGEIRAKSP